MKRNVLSLLCLAMTIMIGSSVECRAEVCNHVWDEWEASSDISDCTADVEQVRSCMNCYETEKRTVLGTEHIWHEWVIKEEATCGDEGKETRECSVCGIEEERAIAKTTDHEWDSWEVTPATISMKGHKVRQCEYCGVTDEKDIPKLKLNAKQKKAFKDANKFLKAVEKYDIGKMRASFSKKQDSLYFEDNAYMSSIMRKYNKKYFGYDVTKIKTSGKTMKVYVEVIYPDAYDIFYKGICKVYDDNFKYVLANNKEMSEKETLASLTKNLNSAMKKYKVSEEEASFVIEMKKVGSTYKITKYPKKLANIMNCGYKQAYDDAAEYAEKKSDDFFWKYIAKYGF